MIDVKWVLTAAQCLFNPEDGSFIIKENVRVVAGTGLREDIGGHRYKVDSFHHPDYHLWDGKKKDIALIKVCTPILGQ